MSKIDRLLIAAVWMLVGEIGLYFNRPYHALLFLLIAGVLFIYAMFAKEET